MEIGRFLLVYVTNLVGIYVFLHNLPIKTKPNNSPWTQIKKLHRH